MAGLQFQYIGIVMKNMFILLGLLILTPFSANAAVVNLNALTTTTANPVELNLTAGTYTVTPFEGNYTSWNAWGPTAGCDNNGANCTRGWINNYSINTPELGTFLLSDGGRYATPELALINALSTTFTLLSDATVKFFISDAPYTDNVGGMSLNVSQVPVPAAAFLFAPALVGFFGLRRKAKQE